MGGLERVYLTSAGGRKMAKFMQEMGDRSFRAVSSTSAQVSLFKA